MSLMETFCSIAPVCPEASSKRRCCLQPSKAWFLPSLTADFALTHTLLFRYNCSSLRLIASADALGLSVINLGTGL